MMWSEITHLVQFLAHKNKERRREAIEQNRKYIIDYNYFIP